MDSYILQKDKLIDFLVLLKEHPIWAPVQRDDTTLFEIIDDLKNISLDLQHQPVIPKSAVFPQTETLFTFDRGASPRAIDLTQQKETIVFAVRPCDARSFTLLDPVFEGDFPDPYYLTRRKKTLLIGIACTQPFLNCFCTSLGGSPFAVEGLDLLFTELNDFFSIEVITDNGKQLIAKTSSLIAPASKEHSTKKNELRQSSESRFKRKLNLKPIPEKLATMFEHRIWQQFASKCIGCGICTYCCPTCYCFDMQDETTMRKGRRVRIWDSCMFPEYTVHASGHNPRPTRSERLKNRIYHKFKFNIDNFGAAGCVGCGRCIALCPVNVDLIENLLAIQEAE